MKILLVAAILLAAHRHAEASCAADADELRAHLTAQADSMDSWDLSWGLAFGGIAAAQTALAITKTKPFGTFTRDDEELLWVGAAKSFIGMGAHTVTAVHVHMPPASADRCAELKALRKTLEKLAKDQRRTLYMTHLGGLAVNLIGGSILWHRRSFSVGLTSVLVSLPVGVVTAYTMPRGAWHRWRDEAPSWTVGVGVGDGAFVLAVGGGF